MGLPLASLFSCILMALTVASLFIIQQVSFPAYFPCAVELPSFSSLALYSNGPFLRPYWFHERFWKFCLSHLLMLIPFPVKRDCRRLSGDMVSDDFIVTAQRLQ